MMEVPSKWLLLVCFFIMKSFSNWKTPNTLHENMKPLMVTSGKTWLCLACAFLSDAFLSASCLLLLYFISSVKYIDQTIQSGWEISWWCQFFAKCKWSLLFASFHWFFFQWSNTDLRILVEVEESTNDGSSW